MLTSAEPLWSQPEQLNMAQLSTNDLQDLDNLFEFGDIDLNIGNVDPTSFTDHMPQPPPQQQPGTHPNSPFNDMNEPPDMSDAVAHDFGGHDQFTISNADQSHHYMSGDAGHAPTSHPQTTESMFQASMPHQYVSSQPQHYQFQPQQHGFPPGHHVPPTPNSYEMHGETAHFMQQHQHQQQLDPQQRAMIEQRYQNGQSAPRHHLPQRHQHQQGYYTNSSTAPSSNATSPVDHQSGDVDMANDGIMLPDSADGSLKKSARRKIATPRSLAVNARLRSSPIQKAQKRKPGKLSTSAENLVSEAQRASKLRPDSEGLQSSSTFQGSSEDGSISPEPLSESLMPPPRRPTSGLPHSPLSATHSQDVKPSGLGVAATPKSILSLRNGQPGAVQAVQTPAEPGTLDDFRLPEAAETQEPALPKINTRIIPAESDESTPRASARKTPKLGPLSTPSSARPGSAVQSPSLSGSPICGPLSGGGLAQKDKKADVKGVKNSKKRGSSGANSAMVSPALRPRISPSIKPLLPEGTTLHSPTHALLLASKSNYQNLLEGNHLPGVNYPDSLSTGLTSKRTSHKVAEQGRRNRINEALKEMQSLLPKAVVLKKEQSGSDASPDAEQRADEDSKDTKEDAAAKSNSSKAATVESANEYIRRLQREHGEKDMTMARLQRKMEELEQRLNSQSSTGAEESDTTPSVDQTMR
nr:phosphorus acquisition-controlling protein [Quercus suber]